MRIKSRPDTQAAIEALRQGFLQQAQLDAEARQQAQPSPPRGLRGILHRLRAWRKAVTG